MKQTDGFDLANVSAWDNISWRIRNGDTPSVGELRATLRTDGVPRELGVIVDDLLFRKRPVGRPPATLSEKRHRCYAAAALYEQVTLEHAWNKRAGAARPRESALATVAADNAMSVDTLREKLKHDLRDAPSLLRETLPTVDDYLRLLEDDDGSSGGNNSE